jgi:hypothetical protein
VKKFYSIKLKQFKENIPPKLAEQMLIDESEMVKFLWQNKALEFRYPKHKQRLDLYADEKFLMIAKLQFPICLATRKEWDSWNCTLSTGSIRK